MKRLLIVILLFGIITGYSNIVFAEDVNVTVGLKTWIATWEAKFTGGSIESDYGLMYGPNINVRSGNFFGGLNYLVGSFSFPTETFYDSSVGDFDVEYEADRTDLDLSAGYYVHPNIAVLLGYKMVNMDFTYSSSDLGVTVDESLELSGPAFGISGHYPIGQSRWVLFGSLSYLVLDGEWEDGTSEEGTGPSIEFGGAYMVEDKPLSVSVGFKHQSFDSDDGEDIFSGLTAGVNYSF